MRSTDLPSGNTAHYNGDYSGDALFDIPLRDIQVERGHVTVKIPYSDIRTLVFSQLRNEMISRIEQSTDDIEKITDLERMNDDDLEKYLLDCGA